MKIEKSEKIKNEVFFATEDRFGIFGKYIDNNSDKVVLFFHGNGGNIKYLNSYEKLFEELGLNVLLSDYRGYGRSHREIKNEKDFFEDSLAAYNFLKKKGFEDKNIILWGHSLGGAVAIDFSDEIKKEFSALVVDSSFDSMLSMANEKYPFLLNSILLKYRFESDKKIKNIKNKILFIHGKNDKVIDKKYSKKLFDLFDGEKKYFLSNGTHNNSIFGMDYEENKNVIGGFLGIGE